MRQLESTNFTNRLFDTLKAPTKAPNTLTPGAIVITEGEFMRNKNNNQGDDMKPLSLEQILNKHKISHLPRTILSYEQGYWFLKNNNQEIQTMICDNETGNVNYGHRPPGDDSQCRLCQF